MANTWQNNDGLWVRFGEAEADIAKGGEVMTMNGVHSIYFNINAADLSSATAAVLGSAVATTEGSWGVQVPEGARILGLEVLTQTAFTSTGTINSATIEIGLIKASDRTTELDYDGFATTGFLGGRMDAVGERTFIEIGSTGVGALVGTTLAEDGLVSVRSAQHATHPLAAGTLRCRLDFYYVQ